MPLHRACTVVAQGAGHMAGTAAVPAKELLEKANHDFDERVRQRTLELESARLRLVEADTTKRTRAVELRKFVESLPFLVWTCTPEGPCDYLSPQWVNYTGISEREQLGAGWTAKVQPE